jgi:hypothetical protein
VVTNRLRPRAEGQPDVKEHQHRQRRDVHRIRRLGHPAGEHEERRGGDDQPAQVEDQPVNAVGFEVVASGRHKANHTEFAHTGKGAGRSTNKRAAGVLPAAFKSGKRLIGGRGP